MKFEDKTKVLGVPGTPENDSFLSFLNAIKDEANFNDWFNALTFITEFKTSCSGMMAFFGNKGLGYYRIGDRQNGPSRYVSNLDKEIKFECVANKKNLIYTCELNIRGNIWFMHFHMFDLNNPENFSDSKYVSSVLWPKTIYNGCVLTGPFSVNDFDSYLKRLVKYFYTHEFVRDINRFVKRNYKDDDVNKFFKRKFKHRPIRVRNKVNECYPASTLTI